MTTTNRIFKIADELDATGQSPTLAAVRKLLGGGSYTTISQAMNEWRAKKATKETPVREAAPQAITELLEQVGMEVWGQALQLANGRLVSEREALDTARQDLEAQRQEAADLADQVSHELETARQEVLALRKQLDAEKKAQEFLKEALRERERDLAVANVRIEEIQIRANQLNEQLLKTTKEYNDLVQNLANSKP